MFRRKGLLLAFLILLALVANFLIPLKVGRVTVRLAAEPLFRVGSFRITNTLVSSWVAMLLLTALAIIASRRLVDVPEGRSLQNIVETVLELIHGLMQGIVGSRAQAFFPVIATFFLYILTSNWLSLLPGFGSIGLWQQHEGQRVLVPLFRGPTTDLNTTIALAVCSVASTQIYGVRFLGWANYGSRFIAVRRFVLFARVLAQGRRPPFRLLVGGVLDLFVGALELFEELTKILSFSFRLFGNVFGGEVLLLVMAFLVPYVASLPFLFLEILGGLIQAYIFAILSTAFLGRATTDEHAETDTSLTEPNVAETPATSR